MDLHTVLVTFHLLGFAFGVGGATVSDVVFVRSVKDGKVTNSEYNIIKTISRVVWTSVVLALASGVWLTYLEYLDFGAWADVPRMTASFFHLKMTAFAALVINGLVFHFKVFPKLKDSIGKSFRSEKFRSKYGLFAFTGGVSIVSWYTAVRAVAFSRFLADFSYLMLLNVYLLLVTVAGAGAYVVLNMHADESSLLRATSKELNSTYIKRAVLAGLLLVVAAVAQLIYA